MTIIVRASYTYWNDGMCHGGGLLEYDNVESAINDLGTIAWHNATNEYIEVEQTIPHGHAEEIQQGIEHFVKFKRHAHQLSKAKEQLKLHVAWLSEVDSEIKRRSIRVSELESEIYELEQNKP